VLKVLEVDGSQRSGSGTILRLSIALASVLGEPLHIYNIRKKRSQPGLRPQHLEAVLTAAKLCDGETEGATLNSEEIWFKPRQIGGGKIRAEIGTAGSIPMLLLTILPICAFAKDTVRVRIIKGGTDVRHSPTINYLKYVLLPMLRRMGLETSLEIEKYGYYPKGMGEVFLEAEPCEQLGALRLENFGVLEEVGGVSVCTFLEDRRVAERQAQAANKHLRAHGYTADIRVVNDRSNTVQKGSSLVLWARTDTGVLLGGDAIGELRKPSEVVGREAAENLYKELRAKPTVDMHLADMLVPYVALAEGNSTYLTRTVTDHLDTNVWLAQKILGVEFCISRVGSLYQVEKLSS
jgi:RNA 3'-terminal phosphate cyclase (ATP)